MKGSKGSLGESANSIISELASDSLSDKVSGMPECSILLGVEFETSQLFKPKKKYTYINLKFIRKAIRENRQCKVEK